MVILCFSVPLLSEATFEGNTHLFHSRHQVQRWLKRAQHGLEEEQMSYAELHVRGMNNNTCDDYGFPGQSNGSL